MIDVIHQLRVRLSAIVGLSATIFILTLLPSIAAAASTQQASLREQHFIDAAAEFAVPKEILMAVSYNQTRWENHGNKPSASGGYGLMHLTTSFQREDGRGTTTTPGDNLITRTGTLDEAARLVDQSPEEIKKSELQNIRAGAALAQYYAKQLNDGHIPQSIDDWYGTVVKLSGMSSSADAESFADNVYYTVQIGASRTTRDGQIVGFGAKETTPKKSAGLKSLGITPHQKRTSEGAECPKQLDCRFVPARNAQNSDDPTDYGNYDVASRPRDMKIKYIVIHDTEGSYEDSISWFQDARSYVAAQYLIRSSDGQVTQMVRNSDVGWHAGNWYMNMHSIGVEHEGYAADGAVWYTEAMYQSSAKLVRYLANKYSIPLDRDHIIGHDQFHAASPSRVPSMHTDPGPYWDWEHYMKLLKAPIKHQGGNGKVVTITPKFAANQQEVQECKAGTCTALPAQGANFVYLRTEPSNDAPLLTDPGLHPDGSAGSTEISDTSAKATFGQRFAVAEKRGEWTAIWFGGYKGWFYNPASNRTAIAARAKRITPKAGLVSIPVYGRPTPEASAFNNGVPSLTPAPLQYKIAAGQKYVMYDLKAPNDYFYVSTFDRSAPGDGKIVIGNETYLPILYGHRQGFVKASDVDILP